MCRWYVAYYPTYPTQTKLGIWKPSAGSLKCPLYENENYMKLLTVLYCRIASTDVP